MTCSDCESEAVANRKCCRACLDRRAAYMRARLLRPEIREKNRQSCLRWYQKTRELQLLKMKQYRRVNKDRLKEIDKHYREKNKEKLRSRRLAQWAEKKEQINARRRQRYQERHAEILALAKQKYHANTEYFRHAKRLDYERHRESRIAAIKGYQQAHPEWHAVNRSARNARRRVARYQAKAAWANQHAITAIYAEAKRKTYDTGIAYHVDHIVPILGKTVCGLHVEYNLQVIQAKRNLVKSNKLMEAERC